MNTKQKDIQDVTDTLYLWMESLDKGDLDQLVATCDPEAITCNERQATTVGSEAIREKYAPRIASATFKSEFDLQQIKVYGDMAIIIGIFNTKMTSKESQMESSAQGRLVLVYRRHDDGSWKMILDVDNNDS